MGKFPRTPVPDLCSSVFICGCTFCACSFLPMTDFTTLQTERIGDVLRITIAHPSSALNAVDETLHHDLTMLFAELRRESTARAVVLTGKGRAFSAGGDFNWFPQLREPGRLEALRCDA